MRTVVFSTAELEPQTNEEQVAELLKTAVPELYEIVRSMNAWDIHPEMVMDFMGAIHRVKGQGWGSVVATIQEGTVKSVEAKTTKLYAMERYAKNI